MPDVRTPGRTRLALDAVVVAIVSLIALTLVWRLWDADWDVPFVYLRADGGPLTYSPDATFYLMLAKGAVRHGWFLTNPALGWPVGQQLHDFPQGLDQLNLVVLQVFALVTRSPGAAVNLLFLSTFVGIPVASFLVGRRLGLSRLAAGVVAVLYTFVPYHFARGTAHVFLSCYWLVPVAALLLVEVCSAAPPFTVDRPPAERATGRPWRVSLGSRSSWWWLAACAGLASTGSYYAAITLVLLVGVVLVDLVARRRPRVAVSAGLAGAAIVVVAMVNLVPTFVHWAREGRNPDLVARGPSETEVNGLKISQLVLPVEGHRVGVLAEAEADSLRFSPIPAERGQNLGAIGAVGFVVVLGAVLVGARRRTTVPADARGPHTAPATGPPPGRPVTPPGDVLRIFGVATVVALVVGAVSGLSLVLSGLGLEEIRSWNRVSIFIAFFALVAVGYGIDRARRRFADRRWIQPVAVGGCALLVVVGVLDQVSPATVPDHAGNRRTFAADRSFFTGVERALPRGSAVFTLPYLFFPESGAVGGIGPYDTVRGYLHTDDLNWSWGGVIGTDADWVAATAGLAETDPAALLDRIAAVGFRGLVLDRRGDGTGDGRGPREDAIRSELGPPDLVGGGGTLAFWDLRTWAADARERLGDRAWRALRTRALADRVADPRRLR